MKKRLSVLVLALAMVLTMSVSVFAVNPAPADKIKAPDAAYLVKYLKMAEGITNPNAEYTFTLTPIDATAITVTDNTVDPAVTTNHTTVPAADFPKKDRSSTLTTKLTATTSAGIENTGDVKGQKSISDIFSGITFPHAGEYLYEVAETGSTFDNSADANKQMTLDGQKYKLHLYVVNDGDNTKIDNVTVEKEDGTKVDPSDVDPSPKTSTDRDNASYKADGFTFTNEYKVTVTTHPDPDDPTKTDTGAFELEKLVTGNYGDKTKKFEFTVTYTLPRGVSATVTTTPALADNKVQLADKESLKFGDLPAGTKITVVEGDYTNVGYKAPVWATTATNNATTEILVGENGAYAKCTNESDDSQVTPTGIIINNLPYVLLIGIALGGIVLFSRKRRYE